ncbi:hypothetical protein NDU88_002294 [Pleurodeles waltl]|uniref:Uncharacterized protein n=1 Tax=Pleurodeles waltl TaxID=8319 RepID=A0AAV7Q9G8_PLEWA|nr:hypothetical protein NDU88_002294 [Pleurodeles waltl]
MSVPMYPEEPSRAELLAAIQCSRVALEGKIETVAVEVNLLRADFRNVSDKVKVVEGSIVELQTEVLCVGFCFHCALMHLKAIHEMDAKFLVA